MVGISIIEKYFPQLTTRQLEKLNLVAEGILHWNEKINVISRKDTENIYTHHILHALGIAKFIEFDPGANVLDLGTGGGLPGLPLAILFPETNFVLLDSRNKKLHVINEICTSAEIQNVQTVHARVEEHKAKYDFIVTRAVAKMITLKQWTNSLFKEESTHALPNGMIALKGGDLREELNEMKKLAYCEKTDLNRFFKESFFETKCIVYMQD